MALTDRQAEAVEWLRTFHAEHGFSPSMRELCVGIGWKSTRSAEDMLETLERKGAIKRERGRARAIVITKEEG
jgi:repressor LexA